MSRYLQLIVFLTAYCIRNNCDQTGLPAGYQLKCKNDACSESIGILVGNQKYSPDSVFKLKFNNEDKIDILGLTLDGQYYFAKLGDRQGLVAKKGGLVREVKRFHKEDDLTLAHLDDSWKPVVKLKPSGEESILHDSGSSVDTEISSDTADDLSISNSEPSIPTADSKLPDSPLERLETSFQANNNLEESTSSLDFQYDQTKTAEASIVIQSEEIAKSAPAQDPIISPSSPSIASDPPSIVQAGTTFALDVFDAEELSDVLAEVSQQSSTPTPSIDVKPPPFLGFSGLGIHPSNLPSENPSTQSSIEVNPSMSIEMIKVSENQIVDSNNVVVDENKIDQPVDVIESKDSKTSPESLSSVIDESTLSTPSSLSSQPQNDLPSLATVSPPQPAEPSSDEVKTGFEDNPSIKPSSDPPSIVLPPSQTTVEEVNSAQNGYTSNSIDNYQSINQNDKLDVNPISYDKLKDERQPVQHTTQSPGLSSPSSIDASILNTQHINHNTDNTDKNNLELDHTNSIKPNQEELKIDEGIKEPIISPNEEIYRKYGTGGEEILDQNNKKDEPSTYPSVNFQQQQQPQQPSSTPQSSDQQSQPMMDKQHHNNHAQPNSYQQQPEYQPITGSNYNYVNSDNSDEMTRQVAADVETSSPSPYLSSLEEPVTSAQSAEDLDSLHSSPSSSPSANSYDSNLALTMQSSLLSNSASPSDQQSTAFTQTSFPETSVPSNYPDAMRSQIALFTTLLPEPVADYLHHINFSPSIFVILLMFTVTWILMYITTTFCSSNKEKAAIEEQLCAKNGEVFNIRTERDYLFDELAAEKQRNSRLVREHLELKEKFEKRNHHIENSESERSDLSNKLKLLDNETCKQKQKIEQLEKNNETLKMEYIAANNELNEKQLAYDKLSQELAEKTGSLKLAQTEAAKYAETNKKLAEELESVKGTSVKLQDDLKRLSETFKTIENLKAELEKLEEEKNSLKSFIENKNPEYSLETLLNGVKLKADLNLLQKQLKSVNGAKQSLSTKIAEIESHVAKADEAIKAKDEAERRLEILKTYFTEQEVKLKAELGTWKIKYEEILARNESVPGYIEDLKRSNEALKMQVDNLEREIVKLTEKHRLDCSKLEHEKHELYLSKIRVVNDFKDLKSECEILRKNLNLKSQGYSDADLKNQTGTEESRHLDHSPPPPPMGYIENSANASANSGPWSLDPTFSNWMNTTGSSTSGYSSLPPAPMPLQHQPPSNYHHQSHHYPPAPPMPPMRDTYSPTSQRSHDQRSVRSDRSLSSTNNSHHYPNYGPPPPLPPQTVQGPFTNPIPSHWSVNTQQHQHYQNQPPY